MNIKEIAIKAKTFVWKHKFDILGLAALATGSYLAGKWDQQLANKKQAEANEKARKEEQERKERCDAFLKAREEYVNDPVNRLGSCGLVETDYTVYPDDGFALMEVSGVRLDQMGEFGQEIVDRAGKGLYTTECEPDILNLIVRPGSEVYVTLFIHEPEEQGEGCDSQDAEEEKEELCEPTTDDSQEKQTA